MTDDLTEDIRRRIAPAIVQRVADRDIDRALDEAAGAAVFALSRLGVVKELPLPPELPAAKPPPPGPILDGREIDCWFEPGDHNARGRTEPPSMVCLHWTGGPPTRTVRDVVQVLRRRRLSIGYVAEADGDVWRTADDMTVTAHAGRINGAAIGIECIGRGFDKSRPVETFLGHRVRLAEWSDRQLAAVVDLVGMLCDRWDIPRVIAPMERSLPEGFRGVVGHFHVHRSKMDPGPRPFEALLAAGFSLG